MRILVCLLVLIVTPLVSICQSIERFSINAFGSSNDSANSSYYSVTNYSDSILFISGYQQADF